jgi:hypothetical protein
MPRKAHAASARKAVAKRPESTNAPAEVASASAKKLDMFFIDSEDIRNSWGKVQFGANPLRFIEKAHGLPPVRIRGVVPQADGSWMVYGYLHPKAHASDNATWSIVRSRTWDGIYFEPVETVYTAEPSTWYVEGCFTHRASDNRLLAFKWARGAEGKGHALWVFGSADGGATWRKLSDTPVYHDHDAFSVIWDEPSQQYVNFQHTYQVWKKPFADNAGSDIRRVFHIRTSSDVLHWTPSQDASLRGPKIPEKALIQPDAQDAPETEFYLFVAFPYAGRYVGMMKHYLPNPPPIYNAGWHGPHNHGEWWVARDFRQWQRPYRDVFAPGEASDVVLHPPMAIGGRHLWLIGGNVYGLPARNLFFAGALSNARFETAAFVAPDVHVYLDAEFNFHGDAKRGFAGQSYLMIDVLDESGNVIEGYEKNRCLFLSNPGHVQLAWRDSDQLRNMYHIRGRTVRLRFHLRDARVYGVHT